MKKAFVPISVVAGVFLASFQANAIPFTSYHLPSLRSTNISKITKFTYSIQKNRIELTWTVAANEESNFFEVERSRDGKLYSTTALVFGTEKTDTDTYQFSEKIKSAIKFYRIKILHKDNSVSYSEAIVTKAG